MLAGSTNHCQQHGTTQQTGSRLTEPAALTTYVGLVHVAHLRGSVSEHVAQPLLASARQVPVGATHCSDCRKHNTVDGMATAC